MNRRSFLAGLAGLPIVGWGARMFGLPKPTAKSGITVHGPEVIVVHDAYNKPRPTLSLRFENVPLRGDRKERDLINRLRPLFGTVNRSDWHWHGDVECARTLMFTDVGVPPPEDRLGSVICAFTPALARRPWPGSHRPVDFETEILKALTGR